jgi:protein tyrosine/serine phosphatase
VQDYTSYDRGLGLSSTFRKSYRAMKRRWKEGWTAEGADPRRTRRAAMLDMMLFDHGFVRLFWRNLGEVDEGVWRGSQPDPRMIAGLARKGFKAILNLRGETMYGSYLLERDACAANEIQLLNIKLESRRLPDVQQLDELDSIFMTIPRPFLMHCKSGADRSGFAAALYLLLRTDAPVAEAKKHLSLRYLHFRNSRAGVLDFMLDAYARDTAQTPVAFRDWIHTAYDPELLMSHFTSGKAADFLMDRVLMRE